MRPFCPLLSIGRTIDVACKREHCGWWNEEKNCCCLKTLAKELTRIQMKVKTGEEDKEGLSQDTMEVHMEVPPICPECGNNQCLLDPEVFARKHLHGASRTWYEATKKALDDFLREQMKQYEDLLKEASNDKDPKNGNSDCPGRN